MGINDDDFWGLKRMCDEADKSRGKSNVAGAQGAVGVLELQKVAAQSIDLAAAVKFLGLERGTPRPVQLPKGETMEAKERTWRVTFKANAGVESRQHKAVICNIDDTGALYFQQEGDQLERHRDEYLPACITAAYAAGVWLNVVEEKP